MLPMNACHFALSTSMILKPDSIDNQGIKDFLMNNPMILMFSAMVLILLVQHILHLYMMKVALIKWCGMC
jgi:hypothetical protein